MGASSGSVKWERQVGALSGSVKWECQVGKSVKEAGVYCMSITCARHLHLPRQHKYHIFNVFKFYFISSSFTKTH